MSMICPICMREGWRKDRIAGQMLALPDSLSVLVCLGCGQRALQPQLSAKDLEQLYSGAYFAAGHSVSASLAANPPPTDYGSQVVAERHEKFARTVRMFFRFNPKAKSALDVGAATGEFVKIARTFGLQADGIELSEFAVRKAYDEHGVKLDRIGLAEMPNDRIYDCIHLNHVFEHFNDPRAELAHIRRLLKPGGLLYIEVPYQFQLIEKLMFKVRGERPQFTLHSLHHPFFYTPATIARLLTEHGFDILRITCFDPERYRADGLYGAVKKSLWRVLASASIGNYIELYARRRAL
jgi:SAM-dependent methyltransferase